MKGCVVFVLEYEWYQVMMDMKEGVKEVRDGPIYMPPFRCLAMMSVPGLTTQRGNVYPSLRFIIDTVSETNAVHVARERFHFIIGR